MLAAENPAVDGGHLASTPRRKGMDCKSRDNANKKLVQARLPFKRLNPEPKENQPPKRPCGHACPGSGVSERENETESSPLPLCTGPPLVNGRGPLDGFLTSRRPVSTDENMIIDLTEEKESPVKSRLSSNDKQQKKRVSSGKSNGTKSSSVSDAPKKLTVDPIVVVQDEDQKQDQNLSTSILDTTQESESEEEPQNEPQDVSSLGNQSLLSNSLNSSMSESSPEKSKTETPTPSCTPTEPKTTPKIPVEKKTQRRSLKGPQEQEEKLRLRQEKERLKEEAKAEKEKKKEDARKQREEREREKREKKEREERERKEKKDNEEKEKAERLKAKEEQRKSKLEAKLEEKRKKDEEKRIKEDEKRLKEEKDRLKAEKAEITRFLQKPKTQQAPKKLSAACGKFAPFEIKENMFLAPLTRVTCDDSVLEKLDEYLLKPYQKSNGIKDWLQQKPRCSSPTKTRITNSLSDCIATEDPKPDGVPDRSRHGPMKLLLFHENYRPAYWGTWSKKSSHISPRCPLRQDKDLLDYEVDSDEEWEEEEPGESLSHSEGEDEEPGEEDDDDDDGFFVPHGYLSDDEVALEEEDGGDLEKQKLQQKLKAKEWDELMSTKKKMKLLEPVVKGCVWDGAGSEMFKVYALCSIEPLAKIDNSPSPEEQSLKKQQETQLLGQLLPLLHGNANSSKTIITEFQEFCRQQSSPSSPPQMSSPQNATDNIPSRLKLRRLIKNSAVYEKRSACKRRCWYVHSEVLSQFGQEVLPVPCQWTYLTTGAREELREESQAATGSVGNSPTTPQTSTSAAHKRRSTGSMSITKFMKRCNETETPEAMEADGFQADTEEDDEDDCVIVSIDKDNSSTRVNSEGSAMDVSFSDLAPVSSTSALTST
ncbi:unnamed protein product [Knipowitschia caucasica]|uniref:Chromatin assembly factor 1 subunit A n=1 Tax=Knipowitschia caucasica TaxID=637954 RepID=A0AAV2KXS6_KNICA